jgi:very-short-patch-repair endonuclease
MRQNDMADALARQCRSVGLPAPVREHRFHPTRGWRLDLAWPERRIACEVDGGVFVGGRHTSGTGYTHDCEKLNEAALAGWLVLRVTAGMVRDGSALRLIERAMAEYERT